MKSARYVLPADVQIIPSRDLSDEVRAKAACGESDFALTNPHARAASKIVDAQAARLLEQFREPTTVVDAIVGFSRSEQADPEATLEAAYPLLQSLIVGRLLVEEGADGAASVVASLSPGSTFAGYEIERPVQVLEDTELYRAHDEHGGIVALKVERTTATGSVRPLFDREAKILERLAGTAAPTLVDHGVADGQAFLATRWFDGVPIERSAATMHARGEPATNELIAVGCTLLEAYAAIHARGYLHADVHPGNLLVSTSGEVCVVDFGLSMPLTADDDIATAPRGGVAFFLDPEYASALLRRRRPPVATARGEQYSLAVVIYLLLTGRHYVDFGLERDEIFRAIVEQPPRAFGDVGARPWPAVERVLQRALAKEPDARYPDVAAFAEALGAARSTAPALVTTDSDETAEPTRRAPDASPGTRPFLDRFLERVGPGGALYASGYTEAPVSSVNFGAAGLAYSLYRIACARDDATLLALADLWALRAARRVGDPEAFYNAARDLGADDLGPNALYHTASGVHVVSALIAHAQGSGERAMHAIRQFVDAAAVPTENLDLALGRTGALLGCALLLEAMPGLLEVRQLGERAMTELWTELDRAPAVGHGGIALNLGIAHGWAGVLYATLRLCDAAQIERPGGCVARLEQLAACAEPSGQGVRWRWTDHHRLEPPTRWTYMAGWCNGSAGFVFLWTLAHRVLGGGPWLDLAQRAARDAWESRPGAVNLCCGATGIAYSLLNCWRATGDRTWRDKAHALVSAAVTSAPDLTETPDSLYRGEPGLALLCCELEHAESARMPMFEDEGWLD